jgi:hypothetical protein
MHNTVAARYTPRGRVVVVRRGPRVICPEQVLRWRGLRSAIGGGAGAGAQEGQREGQGNGDPPSSNSNRDKWWLRPGAGAGAAA